MNQADPYRPCVGLPLGTQFTTVARSRPSAVAVVHKDRRLTYTDLEMRTAGLAGLIAEATEPGSLVGVCLPSGADAVVGIVAIIRAGRAFVPLDPAYPAARLRYLLEDARPGAVVVNEATRSLVRPHAPTIDVGVGGGHFEEFGQQTVDEPAYVIYTSGSTGRPKGVLVSHANVAALLCSGTRLFSFDSEDVWSLFHSISFDFSVWEIWGALLHGARLVIVDDDVKTAPDQLIRLLETERVTVFNVVPSVFREIATQFSERPRKLALRYVIFGGEPVHGPSVSTFRTACDRPPAFVNMYGITETTVLSTARFLTVEDERAVVMRQIGTPLPHVIIRLLDESMALVPPDAIGEVYTAGDGVALGYLRRPELTSERFTWLEDDGVRRRFYRSGDLARHNSVGEFEYVGRIDDQVKINGFRIELGEVEAYLETMPEVQAAAVTVASNQAGDPMLVGYIVPNEPMPPRETRKLRAALRDVVPRHMVPSKLVQLDVLPRTASGKLDRARLSADLQGRFD